MRRETFWTVAPRLLLVAGVLFFIAGWVTWENLSWHAAYVNIAPNTTQAEVEARFKSLKPSPRSCECNPGGFWKREAYAHLIIAGPNRWKYVFYLDENRRVVDKAKWWG